MTKLPIKIFIFISCIYSVFAETAYDIILKTDEKARGKTNNSVLKMRIERNDWSREIEIEAWMKGSDYSFIHIKAPKKDKGTIFLKRKKEVWNWLPSVERIIKIPPSMMSMSWMGSDFTNDDLIKESSIVKDYTHELDGEEVINGILCHKIILVARTGAPVVWGKVLAWISKKDYLQLKSEFYDEEGRLINRMISSDIREFGGRMLPGKIEMVPCTRKGQKTVIEYKTIVFDKEIEDSFFSFQNLKNMK